MDIDKASIFSLSTVIAMTFDFIWRKQGLGDIIFK